MLAPGELLERAGAIGEEIGEDGRRGAGDGCVTVPARHVGGVEHRDAHERERAGRTRWIRAVGRDLGELDVDPPRDGAVAAPLRLRALGRARETRSEDAGKDGDESCDDSEPAIDLGFHASHSLGRRDRFPDLGARNPQVRRGLR